MLTIKTLCKILDGIASRLVFTPAKMVFVSLLKKVCKAVVITRIRQIKSRDFTIIASNCTGTLPYRFLDMPFTSPTINLYFMAPDYLKFVKRLDHYLALPLEFAPKSRYLQAERVRQKSGNYPVGVLDDIEIHFMHYSDEADAATKWNQRKKRINRDKLILTFTDKDLCTPALLREFDSLPYENKFVFTANPQPDIRSSIQVKQYAGQTEMGDAYTNYHTLMHVNFSRLIDAPSGKIIGKVTNKSSRESSNKTKVGRQLETDSRGARL